MTTPTLAEILLAVRTDVEEYAEPRRVYTSETGTVGAPAGWPDLASTIARVEQDIRQRETRVVQPVAPTPAHELLAKAFRAFRMQDDYGFDALERSVYEAFGLALEEATAKASAEWSASLGYGLDPTNPSDVLTPKSPAECGPMMVHLRKERDAAVHQARVDGMAAGMQRAQAICNDYAACAPDDAHKSAGLDLAQELAFACGRLEREQAKPPAPTPPSHGPEQDRLEVIDGDHWMRCGRCGATYPPRGKCTNHDAPAQPIEAKGAPEQARFIKDDDGYWIETRDESESATVFVPIDVVERRVAESRKQYDAETEQACAELIEAGKVLGCQAAEPTLSGARRVVAERDAAEAKAKGNYDEGMKQMLRAGCAERAIEGAKHLLAVEVERANGLERELANLRAEHAEYLAAGADKDAELAEVKAKLKAVSTWLDDAPEWEIADR